MITVEAWQEMTRNIVAAGADQAALTAIVTQADEAMSEVMREYTDADKERSRLREENEALRKANMDFFLRITEKQDTGKQGSEPGVSDAEKITIADLFKEEK